MTTKIEITHLTREIKTALELAIAAFAPNDVLDNLAVVAGLLDALESLSVEPDATPLFKSTVDRATAALVAWHQWRAIHAPPKA